MPLALSFFPATPVAFSITSSIVLVSPHLIPLSATTSISWVTQHISQLKALETAWRVVKYLFCGYMIISNRTILHGIRLYLTRTSCMLGQLLQFWLWMVFQKV